MRVLANVPDQPCAHGVAIDPAGTWAFVVNQGEDDATVLGVIVRQISVRSGPIGLAVGAAPPGN